MISFSQVALANSHFGLGADVPRGFKQKFGSGVEQEVKALPNLDVISSKYGEYLYEPKLLRQLYTKVVDDERGRAEKRTRSTIKLFDSSYASTEVTTLKWKPAEGFDCHKGLSRLEVQWQDDSGLVDRIVSNGAGPRNDQLEYKEASDSKTNEREESKVITKVRYQVQAAIFNGVIPEDAINEIILEVFLGPEDYEHAQDLACYAQFEVEFNGDERAQDYADALREAICRGEYDFLRADVTDNDGLKNCDLALYGLPEYLVCAQPENTIRADEYRAGNEDCFGSFMPESLPEVLELIRSNSI